MDSVVRWIARLPRRLLIGLVRGYRLLISPHFPPTCRYQPTCSQYAIEALQTYGAIKGSILAIYRVLRCHPWGGHGYDPPRWFGEDAPAEASSAEASSAKASSPEPQSPSSRA
jgi:hypothetical protein